MLRWLRAEVSKAPALWSALLVAAAAFAAYANSLDAPFHFDDAHSIVANPYVRDLRYVPEYFHRPDRFSALPGHEMYRPVVLTTYALNYHTGGYDPLFWRLTAIALQSSSRAGSSRMICSTLLKARSPRRNKRAKSSGCST